MNRYEQVLQNALQNERTHYQRQAMQVRQWFRDHPECRFELLPLNWHGEPLRHSERKVVTEYRIGAGWWERVTDDCWIGLPAQRCTHPGEKWLFRDEEEETVSEWETESKQLKLALA